MTRRARILDHLADHPDMTAHDLSRVIGTASTVTDLLRDMETKAQVVSRTERRPGQGRPVHIWRAAPPGAVPPPRSSEAAELVARRRERDRRAAAARRARGRVPSAGAARLLGAACLGADPGLFFPGPVDVKAEADAVAICSVCPVRPACYERAVQNGERFGIWAGVNFETKPPSSAVTGSATSRKEPDHHDRT